MLSAGGMRQLVDGETLYHSVLWRDGDTYACALPDGGMVHKNRDLRIGYLKQVDDIALTDTVWGFRSSLTI